MRRENHAFTRRALSVLLVAGSLPVLHGCGPGEGAGQGSPVEPAGDPTQPPPQGPPAQPGVEPAALSPGIQVSFLLEPGAMTSDDVSDGWVTQSVFTRLGDGPGMQIIARARRADAHGNVHDILALWDADDMLSLSSRHGHEVKITLLRAGDGTLTVRDRGASRRLAITAVEEAGVFTARFFQ